VEEYPAANSLLHNRFGDVDLMDFDRSQPE